MWKPSEVVPEHRGTATMVWIGLILAIIGYTAWQIVSVVDKYSSPSTSFSLSNDLYNFPVVTVCMEDGAGCGFSNKSTETCIQSAMENSEASYLDENVNAIQSEQDNCLKYDLTKFDVGDGEKSERTSAKLRMEWISSDNSSTEMDYITSVSVILGDIDGLIEDMMIPYSRNVYSARSDNSATYSLTELTLGKTERDLLTDSTVETYPVKTTSTLTFVTSRTSGLQSQLAAYLRSSSNTTSTDSYFSTIDFADQVSVGSLFITLTQGSYSYTKIRDINPLELATIIGNIGGFWEILVLAWGLFFISSNQGDGPTLKARKWPVRKGGSEDTARQPPNPSRQASPNEEATEEGPKGRSAWNNVDGLSVSMDESEGRNKRDLATNASATLPGGDDIGDEDCGTERFKAKRILPRMLSWGGVVGGDGGGDGGDSDALTQSGREEGAAEKRARTSFFPSKRLLSTSLKKSFRRQKSGASVAAVTDEEEIFRYDPYSSYGHSTREGMDSRGGASALEVDMSGISGRWDASPRIPSTTMAV